MFSTRTHSVGENDPRLKFTLFPLSRTSPSAQETKQSSTRPAPHLRTLRQLRNGYSAPSTRTNLSQAPQKALEARSLAPKALKRTHGRHTRELSLKNGTNRGGTATGRTQPAVAAPRPSPAHRGREGRAGCLPPASSPAPTCRPRRCPARHPAPRAAR